MLKDCAYLMVVSALHRDEVTGKFRHLGSCLVWEVCRSSVGSGLSFHVDTERKGRRGMAVEWIHIMLVAPVS